MSSKKRDPDGPTGFEALNAIGGRLGDLLNVVASTVKEAAAKAGEEGGSFTSDDTAKGPLRTHVDWTVSVGGIPQTSAKRANDSAASRAERKRPEPKQPEAAPAREPMIEIFAETDHTLVTLELPGVALDEVKLLRKGQTMRLETTGQARFRKDFELPESIGPGIDPERSLRLGILELRFNTAPGTSTT
jgi:HSP20 family molecular chaperone IbpA